MTAPIHYAEPIRVEDPSQCQFYHRMEIPGVGEVGNQWDLRHCIEEYLGRYDFKGKRVLDVGAASGYLTFEMEKRGGDVVSFDMDDGAQWDIVPQEEVRQDLEGHMEKIRAGHRKLKNAYWFCHERLGSKARAFYGDIYRLPEALGPFDVAVMGMIITHLRDPFQAMYNAGRLCRSHLIITNPLRKLPRHTAVFLPSRKNNATQSWWGFSEGCIIRMLEVIGFKVVRIVKSKPRCIVPGQEATKKCYAFVAERID